MGFAGFLHKTALNRSASSLSFSDDAQTYKIVVHLLIKDALKEMATLSEKNLCFETKNLEKKTFLRCFHTVLH